jgi:alkylation response protein AidB-like acyl-CoA dehydrogenase
MDLELTTEQEQLDDALRALFTDHAGPSRVRAVGEGVDTELVKHLEEGGFLDVGYDGGPIEAILVAERASRAVASAPVVARALVAPLAGIRDLPPLVGLVSSARALVRWAGACDAYLVLNGDSASVASRDDVEVEPVPSRAGYPMGRVHVRRGQAVGAGSGDALRRAWQVGIAAEVGSMAEAAVEFSARHVTDRVQFGRAIGSFQAVQHRLARSFSSSQATKWLARRGAWHNGDEFVTASAATFACLTARDTYDDCHQVTGAIGVTSEYDLTAWTMRLLALHSELGGRPAHARRVAQARRAAPDRRLAPMRDGVATPD